jgi:hypothetical protein
MFGGSCRERSFVFRVGFVRVLPAGVNRTDVGDDAVGHVAIGERFGGPGGVAQLGERLNGIQEVEGSIPFGSTKNSLNSLKKFSA